MGTRITGLGTLEEAIFGLLFPHAINPSMSVPRAPSRTSRALLDALGRRGGGRARMRVNPIGLVSIITLSGDKSCKFLGISAGFFGSTLRVFPVIDYLSIEVNKSPF